VQTGLDYRPAPQVLDHLKGVSLVAVVGPTAVGKSTLIMAAMAREPRLRLVLSHFSRAPRAGERQGVDGYFDNRAVMERRVAEGGYVQVAPSVFGDLYATAPEDYDQRGVMIMPIIAQAMPSFRALPFKVVRSIFVVPPDYASWETRLKQHGFTPERLPSRLAEAERSLIYGLEDEPTQLIINDSLDVATEDLLTLALDKPRPPRLQADQSRGREIVASLLEHVRHMATSS
jgi:guanylate kinase